MPLPSVEFCEQLFAHGMLTAEPWESVSSANTDSSSNTTAVEEIIRRADRLARLDAPAVAPPLDVAAAQWALSVLAWSVSLLVDRANATISLPIELASTEPRGDLVCHHWSVDLSLRYLADVLIRARVAAPEDAFVAELVNICSRWPLASVGAQSPSSPGACLESIWSEPRGRVIMEDPSLQRILRDRIIARRDKQLAQHPVLRSLLETYEARM